MAKTNKKRRVNINHNKNNNNRMFVMNVSIKWIKISTSRTLKVCVFYQNYSNGVISINIWNQSNKNKTKTK